MSKSLSTRMATLVPPVRRLYDAVNQLAGATAAVQAAQAQVQPQLDMLRARQEGLAAELQGLQARPPAAAPAAPPAAIASSPAELDRATRREMGEAALRNLPFLPGVFTLREDSLTVEGYCGAPDGLTARMALFVNGTRIEDVDYPVEDPELKSRFPDVPGMGLVFRARIRGEALAQLRSQRFWRFDAAPTGRFNPADWRRAIHYMNPAMERFAFPPEPNIRRVIGDTSTERFAMGGAIIFNNAQAYLRELGRDWQDFPQILDWGCGAGRLTRYLIGETPCAVTGIDIDPDNIAWCQAHYPGGSFRTAPLRPRTDLEDGRFDLVFGLSVMTHLQENDQFLWLEELHRITRPGALLLLSIQGPTQFAYNRFPPEIYRRLQEVGYIDLQRDPALEDVVTDKEYYRSAMQSRPYVVKEWGKYFEVLAFADAIAGLQDFVVLARR